MKVKAFILHLARAEARRAQAEKLVRTLPMPAEILDAVDGLALSKDQIGTVYRRHLHSPRYPFELRKQEIGCFLSHRRAWQAIAGSDLEFGLIVEDDVELEANFAQVFAFAAQHMQSQDYLRFPRWPRGDEGPVRRQSGEMRVIEPRLPGLGMQTQLVGRDAAHALLQATGMFDRPVDTTIQMRWLHQARVQTVRPVCIREIHRELGGTVIQKKAKPLTEILAREVRRPLYRLAVRLENSRRRAGR
jgi:GR25 family glycosyltransferase involved in LPS biosynthesis